MEEWIPCKKFKTACFRKSGHMGFIEEKKKAVKELKSFFHSAMENSYNLSALAWQSLAMAARLLILSALLMNNYII